MDTIDEAAMKELYAMRWGVEEGFKKLKPKMKLEQFGCRRHEGVYPGILCAYIHDEPGNYNWQRCRRNHYNKNENQKIDL